MYIPAMPRSLGLPRNRSGKLAAAALLLVLLTIGSPQGVNAAESTSASAASTAIAARAAAATAGVPVFKIVEGAKGSPDPYTPRVLEIPAGREVALDITDNIGGCALVTVFPGLGLNGRTVRARVPVGQTRRVLIRAAKAGRYRYHCGGDMYFGEIVAR